MEMTFTSDIKVELVQKMGSDAMIVSAARVSTKGQASRIDSLPNPEVDKDHYGLIRYLMQHRHGTPFEHSATTFFVHAPIFVWREWHRHRIGFSYNEESGRYKTLDPVFYIPPRDRPMMKVDGWKPGRPKFLTLDKYAAEKYPALTSKAKDDRKAWADNRYTIIFQNLQRAYAFGYDTYLANLQLEIDPGLARDCLPVGIYSSCWVTCNPRSLMAFLSLRTHHEEAKQVSYPLYEIEVAANAVEEIFKSGWPLVYKAFVECGRVAP